MKIIKLSVHYGRRSTARGAGLPSLPIGATHLLLSTACVLWTQVGCCFIDSSTDVQLTLRLKTQILRKTSVNNS